MTHSSSVARRALSGNGRQHHWSGYTPETAYYLKEISEEEVVRWGGGGGGRWSWEGKWSEAEEIEVTYK